MGLCGRPHRSLRHVRCGNKPPQIPRARSPRQVPPPPPAPIATVQVVDVHPVAPLALPLESQRKGVSVTLNVQNGIISVPNPSNRTQIVAEGLNLDAYMPPVVEVVPKVAPIVPREPVEVTPSTSEPFGHRRMSRIEWSR